MKKFKPVSVKTTVLGRKGKAVIHTPLSVNSAANSATTRNQPKKSAPGHDQSTEENLNADDYEVSVFTPEASHSGAYVRNVSSVCNWEKVRGKLLEATVEEEGMPESGVCVVCKEREPSLRCRYCGPRQFFCSNCARDLHVDRNQFHVLEQWKDNRFVPLFSNHGVLNSGHRCATTITKLFKLVDAFGNQHLKEVAVCDCESHAVTLVRCQFWPGSPERPSVGFHFKLMDLAEKLFLHSQVSVKAFSELLQEMIPPMQPTFISSLYSILNSGCFEEYRYFKYKLKYLNSYIPGLYNGAECPLCPKENGILIESVDACFGLARRKAKGGNIISSRHGDLIFSDQDDVDNYVDNYPHTGKTAEEDCNRFHAGEVLPALRSKGKNQLFDEKGVFGRVCRHDFPKSLLSIKYGERVSYSVYELKKMRETTSQNSLKFILMYDIACLLSSHLKKSNQEELLSDVTLAIPIFHCYGHKASCQVQFSPRRTKSIGLTDGEGVERFWAYLRQFSSITKEMSVDKRNDALTDAALHYGEHLFSRFGLSLAGKLKRALSLSSTVGDEITELVAALPDGCDLNTVSQWTDDEMSEIIPSETVLTLQWDEKYVELLKTSGKLKHQLDYAREEEPSKVDMLERKISRNEKAIAGVEKKNSIRVRWKENEATFKNALERLTAKRRSNELMTLHKMASERVFLLELKAKYADGQAIAIKLANQIDKVVNSMKQELATLNGLLENETVTFDEIKDPCGDIFSQHHSPTDTSEVPFAIKKKLVQLACFLDRCKEEEVLVKDEMLRFITFISNQISLISSYLGNDVHVTSGLRSLLLQKAALHKKTLHMLRSVFGDAVTIPPLDDPEETYSQFSEVEVEVEVEDFNDVEDLFDLSAFEDLDYHCTPISGWSDDV